MDRLPARSHEGRAQVRAFCNGAFRNLRQSAIAGDLRGPATEIPTPPSDHIPLWWRCAFRVPDTGRTATVLSYRCASTASN